MRDSNFIKAFIIICCALAFVSCKTSPKKAFSITNLDTTIKAKKISISELAKNYKLYHGHYIETVGRFHSGFEEFAIYTNKNILTGEANGFWLEFNEKLIIDDPSFEIMNGKLVTIKGRVNTLHKGHLSGYLAAIRGIYFWQN